MNSSKLNQSNMLTLIHDFQLSGYENDLLPVAWFFRPLP